MKKYIIASLMIMIPFITWANDHCTNPSAYTIDKRCYVTDEEKAQKPYNTTVALINHTDNTPMCTGTIIQIQDMLVVYTAAHCIVFDEHKAEKIKIRLQDGREFIASHNNSGNFVLPPETVITEEELEEWIIKNNPHDWAIYNIPEQYYDNIPYTSITNKNHSNALHNATVVGYGSLKIMSDNDINDFKQKYIDYLNGRPQNEDHGFVNDNIVINNPVVLNFLDEHQIDIYDVIFNDNKKLKQSKCKYGGEFSAENCQVWPGNSGGPVYDNNNHIMGIVTLVDFLIGGKQHANMHGTVSLLQ